MKRLRTIFSLLGLCLLAYTTNATNTTLSPANLTILPDTIRFIGTISNDWSEPGNWDLNQLPGINHIVIIDGHDVVYSNPTVQTVEQIDLLENSSLEIAANTQLTIQIHLEMATSNSTTVNIKGTLQCLGVITLIPGSINDPQQRPNIIISSTGILNNISTFSWNNFTIDHQGTIQNADIIYENALADTLFLTGLLDSTDLTIEDGIIYNPANLNQLMNKIEIKPSTEFINEGEVSLTGLGGQFEIIENGKFTNKINGIIRPTTNTKYRIECNKNFINEGTLTMDSDQGGIFLAPLKEIIETKGQGNFQNTGDISLKLTQFPDIGIALNNTSDFVHKDGTITIDSDEDGNTGIKISGFSEFILEDIPLFNAQLVFPASFQGEQSIFIAHPGTLKNNHSSGKIEILCTDCPVIIEGRFENNELGYFETHAPIEVREFDSGFNSGDLINKGYFKNFATTSLLIFDEDIVMNGVVEDESGLYDNLFVDDINVYIPPEIDILSDQLIVEDVLRFNTTNDFPFYLVGSVWMLGNTHIGTYDAASNTLTLNQNLPPGENVLTFEVTIKKDPNSERMHTADITFNVPIPPLSCSLIDHSVEIYDPGQGFTFFEFSGGADPKSLMLQSNNGFLFEKDYTQGIAQEVEDIVAGLDAGNFSGEIESVDGQLCNFNFTITQNDSVDLCSLNSSTARWDGGLFENEDGDLIVKGDGTSWFDPFNWEDDKVPQPGQKIELFLNNSLVANNNTITVNGGIATPSIVAIGIDTFTIIIPAQATASICNFTFGRINFNNLGVLNLLGLSPAVQRIDILNNFGILNKPNHTLEVYKLANAGEINLNKFLLGNPNTGTGQGLNHASGIINTKEFDTPFNSGNTFINDGHINFVDGENSSSFLNFTNNNTITGSNTSNDFEITGSNCVNHGTIELQGSGEGINGNWENLGTIRLIGDYEGMELTQLFNRPSGLIEILKNQPTCPSNVPCPVLRGQLIDNEGTIHVKAGGDMAVLVSFEDSLLNKGLMTINHSSQAAIAVQLLNPMGLFSNTGTIHIGTKDGITPETEPVQGIGIDILTSLESTFLNSGTITIDNINPPISGQSAAWRNIPANSASFDITTRNIGNILIGAAATIDGDGMLFEHRRTQASSIPTVNASFINDVNGLIQIDNCTGDALVLNHTVLGSTFEQDELSFQNLGNVSISSIFGGVAGHGISLKKDQPNNDPVFQQFNTLTIGSTNTGVGGNCINENGGSFIDTPNATTLLLGCQNGVFQNDPNAKLTLNGILDILNTTDDGIKVSSGEVKLKSGSNTSIGSTGGDGIDNGAGSLLIEDDATSTIENTTGISLRTGSASINDIAGEVDMDNQWLSDGTDNINGGLIEFSSNGQQSLIVNNQLNNNSNGQIRLGSNQMQVNQNATFTNNAIVTTESNIPSQNEGTTINNGVVNDFIGLGFLTDFFSGGDGAEIDPIDELPSGGSTNFNSGSIDDALEIIDNTIFSDEALTDPIATVNDHIISDISNLPVGETYTGFFAFENQQTGFTSQTQKVKITIALPGTGNICRTSQSGDFENASNWDCGRMPTNEDLAIIAQNIDIQLNSNPGIDGLKVEKNALFPIPGNFTVNVFDEGVKNNGILDISGGLSINLDASLKAALNNNGQIIQQPNADIQIGQFNNSVPGIGILNEPGGNIQLSGQSEIHSTGVAIQNMGELAIKDIMDIFSGNTSGPAVHNQNLLTVTDNASLHIQNDGSSNVFPVPGMLIEENAMVNNHGSIDIEDFATGIFVNGVFTNTSNNTLRLDNITSVGIDVNTTGTVTNTGTIRIGETQAVDGTGIFNFGNFLNALGATLFLAEVNSFGIDNQNTFTNAGLIQAGSAAKVVGATPVVNFHFFTNEASGVIMLNNIIADNTLPADAIGNISTFINHGKIDIGNLPFPIQENGIFNLSNFTNKATGVLNISSEVQGNAVHIADNFFDNEVCGKMDIDGTLFFENNATLINSGVMSLATTNFDPNNSTSFFNFGILTDINDALPALSGLNMHLKPIEHTLGGNGLVTNVIHNFPHPDLTIGNDWFLTENLTDPIAATFDPNTNTLSINEVLFTPTKATPSSFR